MTEPGDLYELLGIPRDASTADITRAYRRQARLLHPDARPGQPDEPERFRAVAAAYHVLGDPARRAAYDQALSGSGRSGPASRPPVPPPAAPAPPPAPPAGWPPGPWLAPPAFPGGFPAGATLRAGPARVDPPGSHPPAGGRDYDTARHLLAGGRDYDTARLAALALLLARHLDAADVWEWPW